MDASSAHALALGGRPGRARYAQTDRPVLAGPADVGVTSVRRLEDDVYVAEAIVEAPQRAIEARGAIVVPSSRCGRP